MSEQNKEKISLQKLAGIVKEATVVQGNERAYYADKEYFASVEFTEKAIDDAVKKAKRLLEKLGEKGYVTEKEYRKIIGPLYNTAFTSGEMYLRKKIKSRNL